MVFPKYPCKGQYTLLLICLFAAAVQAQAPKTAQALYTDLPIADMSSFTLLNTNPYKIARPAGAKELAAAVLCIAKSDVTNAVPGIALEWAPYQTFDKNRISGNRDQAFTAYKRSLVLRNLQLSFAGVQDSFASRLSAGLSFVIFDHSDPSYDERFAKNMLAVMQADGNAEEAQKMLQDDFLHERLDSAFRQLGLRPSADSLLYWLFNFRAGRFNPDSISAEIGRKFGARLGFDRGFDTPREKAVNGMIDDYLQVLQQVLALRRRDGQELARLVDEERKRFVQDHWNAGVLKIGLGNTWYAPDFNWSHLQSNKFSSFVTWAFRVGKWGQGIVFTQYTRTYAEDVKHKSSWVYGGRVVGGIYRVHGSLELALHSRTYSRFFGKIRDNINTIRGSAGVEARVTKGLWVEVVVGVNGPYSDFARNDGGLVIANLKYTFKRPAKVGVR